jgi:MoaA/NifB/PqqE/SkfB family radical SAM enzyme
MGASGIQFYRFLSIGYAKLGQKHILPDALLPQFFALLKQEKTRRKMPVKAAAGFSPVQRLREKLAAQGKEYCPAGRKMFAITPTGKVYGCPLLISDGKEIGSLKDDGTIVVSREIDGDRSNCIAAQTALSPASDLNFFAKIKEKKSSGSAVNVGTCMKESNQY